MSQYKSFNLRPAQEQELTFKTLAKTLKASLGIQKLTKDVLLCLGLLDPKQGYTNAGALLADHNHFPGIELVRYGQNKKVIRDRASFAHMSLLKQYSLAVAKYRQYYQQEQIKAPYRETVELVPADAFSEALASTLVHRNWDIASLTAFNNPPFPIKLDPDAPTSIKLAMFPDRIEITTCTKVFGQDNWHDIVSNPLNPQLAYLFYRLGLLKHFETHLTWFKQCYAESDTKPGLKLKTTSETLVLPVMQNGKQVLTPDELAVYEAVKSGLHPITQITTKAGFSRSKTLQLLNKLISKGYLAKTGRARATRYYLP